VTAIIPSGLCSADGILVAQSTTNKEVGDVNHLKVFATPELADEWLRDTIRKAWHSNMRFWSDRYDKA
jgi:hypothetical protein